MASYSNNESMCRRVIRCLLISTNDTLSIQRLCHDFSESEGYKIPFREFGFNSLEAYLRSIPDTLHVYGSGVTATVEPIIDSKVAHISAMVAKQRRPPSRRGRRRFDRPCPARFRAIPERQINYSSSHNRPGPSSFHDQCRFSPEPQPISSLPTRRQDIRPPLDTGSGCDKNFTPRPVPSPELQEIPSLMEMDCRNYYSNYNQPATSSFSQRNVEISSKSFYAGVNLVPPPVDECSDEDYDIARQILDSKTTPILVTDCKSNCPVPKDIQNNLIKLISNLPDGILCTKLPREYRNLFGKGLHYEKYHYRSLIEMITDLPEIFHYLQPSQSDFLIFDKNIPLPNVGTLTDLLNGGPPQQSSTLVTSSILDEIEDLTWDNAKLLIPPDVMGLTDKIPRHFIEDETEGPLLDICVADIYDVSKFWIYRRLGPLDKLMKDLQEHFSDPKNILNVPDKLQNKGLYCAAPYFDEIHRALIINDLPHSPERIKVFFIDYGTVEYVKSINVYYLPKHFGEIPAQALRARLSNIYPLVENAPWSIECTNKFKSMVDNRNHIIEIIKIDHEDFMLEVYLTDITSVRNIFHVNDVLVKQGFAQFISVAREKPLVDSKCRCTEEYIHLFPTFVDIENGHAPTSDEMIYCFKHDVTIDHFHPQYYKRESCEDVKYADEKQDEFNLCSMKLRTIECIDVEEEIDYSLFPQSIHKEMKSIMVDVMRNKKQKDKVEVKTDSVGKSEVKSDIKSNKNVGGGGFCNRNIVNKYLDRKTSDDADVLHDLNPFKNMSLQDCPVFTSLCKNPFLESDHESSPSLILHSTLENGGANPFIDSSSFTTTSSTTSKSSPIDVSVDETLARDDGVLEVVRRCDTPAVCQKVPPGFAPNSNLNPPSFLHNNNSWMASYDYINYGNPYHNNYYYNMAVQFQQMGPFMINQQYPPIPPVMNFPNPVTMPENYNFPPQRYTRLGPMPQNYWQPNQQERYYPQGPYHPPNQ